MGKEHSLNLSFNMMNWILFHNNGGVRHMNPEVHFITLTEKYFFIQGHGYTLAFLFMLLLKNGLMN